MNSNQHSNITSRVIISIVALVALTLIAVLLSAAMQAGGWMFIGLIAGLVALAALSAWLVSFIVRLYVQWSEARNKSREAQNSFMLNCLKAGFLPDGSGGFKPIETRQIAAPKPKEIAPADPRKQLLIELCLMTIRSGKRDEKTNELVYGPASKRLMTADDAQAASKARGGAFADRSEWDKVSKYAQENYLVFEKRGGKEQGMMVDQQRVGGETIADLIGVLMRNPALDAAVNALPANER